MNLTLSELMDRIVVQFDPSDLIERLQISIEELVEAFTDKIEDNYDILIDELTEDET